MIQDRESRFIVAHASGRHREETLATEAIRKAHARSQGQPVPWCSDGWRAYPKAITHAYRRPPVRTGRRGRPPLRLPEGLSLTQTIKHREEHGRLLSVETRATIGAAEVEQPVRVHIEWLSGVLRDRLACLTRKTHAFAKRVPRRGRRCSGWRSLSTTGYDRTRRLVSRAACPDDTTSGARQRWLLG